MKKETKDTLISFGIAIILFSVFIGLLLMMGCTSQPTQTSVYNPNNVTNNHLVIKWAEGYMIQGVSGSSGTITKIFIPEDNVTCYTFDNYEGGGISCLAS